MLFVYSRCTKLGPQCLSTRNDLHLDYICEGNATSQALIEQFQAHKYLREYYNAVVKIVLVGIEGRMSALAWGNVSSRRLLENITLLCMLDEVPEMPKANVLSDGPKERRILPIQLERDIVDDLAFLSSYADDSNKVMAVCIEEHHNGESLIIRIACNSGGLQKVKDGFTNLANVLQKAASRGLR